MLTKQVKARIRRNKARRLLPTKFTKARGWADFRRYMNLSPFDTSPAMVESIKIDKVVDYLDPLPPSIRGRDQMLKGGFKRGECLVMIGAPIRSRGRIDLLPLYRQLASEAKDYQFPPIMVSHEADVKMPFSGAEWYWGIDPGVKETTAVQFKAIKRRQPVEGQPEFMIVDDPHFLTIDSLTKIKEPLNIEPMGHQNPDGSFELTAWSIVDKEDKDAQGGTQA